MEINIVTDESDRRDHLKLVVDAMNEVLQRIKESDPLGYLDNFDSRQETILTEVVHSLGGTVEFKSSEIICNFSNRPAETFSLPG